MDKLIFDGIKVEVISIDGESVEIRLCITSNGRNMIELNPKSRLMDGDSYSIGIEGTIPINTTCTES